MKKIIAIILAIVTVVGCVCMFAACGDTESEPVIKMVNVDLSSEEYGFAIRKGDTALKASVNAFFAEKKDEIAAIFDKYTAEDADLSSFGKQYSTESTNHANELVVATNLEFAPFEYTNGNKIAGIDMEIAELLAQYLGKTLVIKHMDFEAVVSTVQNDDNYDIGIAGLTISPDRMEMVDFSDAYFGATQVLIVKEGDNTFADCTTAEAVEAKLASLTGDAAKCGGQTGTTSQFYINGNEDMGFDGFSNLKFGAYASAALAIQDMLNGKIAFVVVDKTTAAALVKSFND